ncbi:hypothetical protein AAHB63_09785 [Bacillus thuringiensis]|uniref:Uncharacterized protein n=2 Tax=Bacillus cereus group TaxID=86661 RepID=A0A9W3KGF1_BACTU|nr:hypothetical protein YBT1518_22885 [Bacillus thuringiensis YBT-1518]
MWIILYHFLMKIMLRFLCIIITGIISGYIGLLLFKNYPIHTAEQIRGTTGKATDVAG